MPLYGFETELGTEEVIEKAVGYFGDEIGLEMTSREDCCASFRGSGGHVALRVIDGEPTQVELETREWDYQVKQFMRALS